MRRARWAALAAVVLLLAGCAEIPTDGAVRSGATELPNDPNIVFVPNKPVAGASPRDIVTGFLTAASAGGDFDVARQYLATSFSAKWRPRTRVLVQDAQPTFTSTSDSDLVLEVPTSGRVNERGSYEPTPGDRTTPLKFHLTQQAGQWRIDSAPNGIVLGETVFQSVYKPQALQFFDPRWTRLVPDVRWFPVSSAAAFKESLVRELIAGPVGPVGSDVTVNALAGAQLGSVTDGDVTTVVLSTPGRDPSTEVIARMQQQILQTLLLPTPSALQLIVNGRAAAPAKPLPAQTTSLNAYVVAGGRFGTMAANGTFAEDTTLGPRIATLKPIAVTISPQQRIAAVLTGSGDVAMVTATGNPRIVDTRPGLVDPTLDQRGWVYSVPEDSPSGVQASDGQGPPVDLIGSLGGGTVKSIEVSPDGTRMLVLLQSVAGPQAFVAGIERNADGAPIGLTNATYPVALGASGGKAVDATWVDSASVAVLSESADTTERVQVQRLGAGVNSLGALANATSIVGTLSESYLRVRLQSGDIWTWTSNLWQSQGSKPVNVSVLAVQR